MQRQTVCRSGLHPLDDENTHVDKNGTRRCRACMRTWDRERHRRQADERNAAAKRRRQENPEATKMARRKVLLAKFGMTHEDYDALLESQNGQCAICGTTDGAGRWNTYLHVDHDHETGVVRGLLCGHCNVMLGNAKDDPTRLREAADYLERER